MACELPRSDHALKAFVTSFHNACSGNLTVLGLSSAQVTALYDDLVEFDTALSEHETKTLVARGATATKEAKRATMVASLRPLIRIIRGHDVPEGLLEELGIGPIDPSHPAQPEQPMHLLVTPYAIGTNWLRWQRGTNKKATTYQVEVQNADTDGWQIIATVNRLNYKHMDQEPGFQQTYRVRAVRKGIPGVASFPATVYGPEQTTEVVQLKAA